MKFRFFSIVLLALSLNMAASSVSAQVPISIGGLELSSSVENPLPGQKVTITAKSYTISIDSSKVVWVVNGSVVKNAVGATSLEVTAPALGKKTTINVSATTPEGRVVQASLTLASGSVDLIIETDGYVPPYFKGKVAPVYQNAVKVIAVPHLANSAGVEYDPSSLIYQWKRNDRAIEDQSGYGKQSIIQVGNIVPRSYDLTVEVSSRDGLARADNTISISYSDPDVTFYLDDPLYGTLLNRNIRSSIRIGSQKETSIRVVPFGFNGVINSSKPLSFSWLINNVRHNELSTNRTVVLRAPDETSGLSNITLNIDNSDKILQHGEGGFSASFTQSDSSQGAQSSFNNGI